LNWGILGAARINRRIAPAIHDAGSQVVALAASSLTRAEEAAAAYDIPRAHEGYQRALDDPDVEIVYLPLANSLHPEWLRATAEAGKACLCEKPLVLSAAEAGDVRDRFAAAGRPLVEAFMWRHHPQATWLKEQLVPGRLGEPKRIHATFSFPLDRPDDYRWSARMGGGAIADIGGYGVNAARYFFGAEPIAVSFRGEFRPGPDGVDDTAAGWLDFGEGRLATISCSIANAFAQGLEVVGTEGRAWVERPWLSVDVPTRVIVERGHDRETKEFPPVNAYRTLVEHFERVVRDGADLAPAETGVEQAAALEAAIHSARREGAASGPIS
jgi:predicted dehydrogenase